MLGMGLGRWSELCNCEEGKIWKRAMKLERESRFGWSAFETSHVSHFASKEEELGSSTGLYSFVTSPSLVTFLIIVTRK